MKIPSPFPHQQHIRFNVNNGECLGACGEGPEIEVPDMAVEVLIEPVNRGRYDADVTGPGYVWSKEFGMLSVEDHVKKMQIKEEEAALKARQKAERDRKREEAKVAKPKAEIKVDRAPSGMAKVTKTKK